ncbi:MAG: type II toxin-antitoxin system VapC family toxin [Rhodospirillales bacterium]|nr:type II toxin-antitoxin system VapC family toxin [Rhodospirillales bacterium]
MKLLLDTHLLLWLVSDSPRLPAAARDAVADPDAELIFSVASIWEAAIKIRLRHGDFRWEASVLRRGLLDNDFAELPITGDHALAIATLPPIHKDPFDRILLAQAGTEGILLLTADPLLAKYPGPVRLV